MNKTLKTSRRQEQRVADEIGGRAVPGSGNQWHRKNDVRSDDLSLELKYTDAKSYSLKSAELEKGRLNALADGRDFAFGIQFKERSWVVITHDDWLMYLEAFREVSGHGA